MTKILRQREPSWLAEERFGARPDLCLSLAENGKSPEARCSLWWSRTPRSAAMAEKTTRLGLVGHFSCADADAGATLLKEATSVLLEAGCERAAGPMDGDTWHAYRLVTQAAGGAPRFFLEPWNDTIPVEAFQRAGFEPWARYSSSELELGPPSPGARERRERIERRLADRGVTLRPLDRNRFVEELDRLHALSEVAFRDNFLYTPIDRSAFHRLYLPVESLVDPRFVCLAEREGKAIGFVFAMPDRLAPAGDRLVVKTLAVHPRCRQLGLGTVLVERVQEQARAAGFGTAIHALQYEGNSSRKITRRQSGRLIREYTLLHRQLPVS